MNTLTLPIKNILTGSMNSWLLAAFIGMFVAYSFLIGSTVISINERKNLYSDIRTKQAQLSELEIKYFTVAQGIDLNKAKELGFIDTPTTFAYTNAGAKDAVAIR
jgi:hypothetical protein